MNIIKNKDEDIRDLISSKFKDEDINKMLQDVTYIKSLPWIKKDDKNLIDLYFNNYINEYNHFLLKKELDRWEKETIDNELKLRKNIFKILVKLLLENKNVITLLESFFDKGEYRSFHVFNKIINYYSMEIEDILRK